MLTDQELQSLRNLGNEAESAADEIEQLRKDAARYRYLRNRIPHDVLNTRGDAPGCWIDHELEQRLELLTGPDADAKIDAAMAAGAV